ncbi:MAG: hypothetical protein FWC96_06900 [Oscillospiraceae bacterium]|nr:hypothetical protein [Oscillospiraceae bacterium]
MKKAEIKNIGLLAVDMGDGKVEYGCNQDWYNIQWQRHAGCGPSVVSTMLGYLQNRTSDHLSQQQWLALMEDVWTDVTPTYGGIPSTRHLTTRIEKYLSRCGLDFQVTSLNVPGQGDERPGFVEVRDYLTGILSKDAPIALLNLDTGGVETLDEWHWTIIPSMMYDDTSANVVNYNCGEMFDVDIKAWYEATTLGGGLVAIIPSHIV